MENATTPHSVAPAQSVVTPVPQPTQPSPKWAAVVADTLVPLPRRLMRARDILHQAGADGKKLIRDLNTPFDVGFADDAEVDLAQGNVFRLEEQCECHHNPAFPAPPKLAFVVDDAWEVTTNPKQTVSTMRGLFDLAAHLELLRDFESPIDALIGECEEIDFADGPVFRTERRDVTVTVNNKPVTFENRRDTGLEIKETAIKQKVNIQTTFVLYQVLPDDSLSPAIADDQRLILTDCDAFRCVAPDDNS
jgi:hypothetical protein